MTDQTCRWDGRGKPRLLKTHIDDTCPSSCDGCEPCGDKHCGTCGIQHVDLQTCPTCVGHVRDDLDAIEDMSTRLLGEAVYRGVNSEAANLAGPVANPEAWSHRAASARKGRAPHISLDEDDDLKHPLWVCGTWEMLVREHLEQPTEALMSIAAAKDYLHGHLTTLAQDEDFAFEEMAKDIRACRSHLEDVLREGEREERGEKCYMCGKKHLVKDYGKTVSAKVMWRCPNTECQQSYTEDEYREKFETKFIKNAPELTLTHMATRLPAIPASTMRRWASKQATGVIIDGEKQYDPPLLKSCGKDSSKRKVYRVADVQALWVNGGKACA